MNPLKEREDVIKACQEIIQLIESNLTAQSELVSSELSSEVVTVDENDLTFFPPSTDVDSSMINLTEKIQSIIANIRPQLSELIYNYLLDTLYPFHFQDIRFSQSLTLAILPRFKQSLDAFIASLKAYVAAEEGNVTGVKEFFDNYALYKNKPLLNGFTLLYVATSNDRRAMVKYLIEEAKCSVNAQNQSNDGLSNYTAAGSTALHSACADGRADLVRYLLSKGANCYIENTKKENPIMCIKNNPALLDIFRQHLIVSYINLTGKDIPTMTISQEKSSISDLRSAYNCVWEHKPLHQTSWARFSQEESDQLSISLVDSSKLEFDITLDMSMEGQMYTISMMKFLKSGNNSQINENQAWIRCRGSSYLNFNSVPIWQIMITKHPSKIDDEYSIAELNILEIPSVFDAYNFKYQLNSWYYCDASLSQAIDEAMDQRIRQTTLHTMFLENSITVNLETFSFVNETSTIEGFIRWLPKFVTVDLKTKRITPVNNFQARTLLMSPVVLTNTLLKEAADAHQSRETTVAIDDDEHIESIGDQDQGTQADFIDNENNENEDVNQFYRPSGIDVQPAQGEKSDDEENDMNEIIVEVRPTTASTSRQQAQNELTDKQHDLGVMKAQISKQQQLLEELQSELNKKKSPTNDEEQKLSFLRTQLGVESEPSEELLTSRSECAKLQEKLNLRQIELDDLRNKQNNIEQELNNARTKLENINRLEQLKAKALNDLVSIEYSFIVKDYTPIQQKFVVDYLKSLKYPNKNEQKDNLITIDDHSNPSKDGHHLWQLKAYPMHHNEMENIHTRLDKLIEITQSQHEYYNRVSKRALQDLLNKCIKPVESHIVRSTNNKDNWKIFSDHLIKLINEKREELCQTFRERIRKKCKSIVDLCIKNVHNWQQQLYDDTKDFIRQHSVLNSIEKMKQNAFEHFVEDAKMKSMQSVGQKKIEGRSIDVRNQHLLKLQQQFESQEYVGHELKHFNLIPSLLQRVHIYCRCFQLNLPLFDSSIDLLDNIERNTVVAISTGTGSGKSTLMPPLLAADNYDKIFVTQPRRLPCNLLSSRVNSCIAPISGWAVSGSRSANATHSPILYFTDGLLKDYLLYRENEILRQANSTRRGLIFFVDEVHERSINIDLCLALLARLLTLHPDIQSKIKIIISSATLGPDVSTLFQPFRFHQEKLKTPALHTVMIKSSDENMFDLIHRLAEDCVRGEQILCFVKSNMDVQQSIKLLRSIKKRGSHPLVQSQSAAEQEQLIKEQTIFFSTTVAETSLTFPCLKYVVDTGVINMPIYDPTEDSTVLQEIPAAESTIKQRQGRLGRTQDGEYFSLYKHRVDKKYPTPQICQSELSNIEFSLRRSPLKQGLKYLKKWLPNPPNDLVITLAIKRLRDIDILDKTEAFTSNGSKLAQLPDFGSVAMSRAILAGLEAFNCGRDLIRLASVLSVLNTSAILRSIPSRFKRAEGDFMTLLSVMDAILAQKRIIPPHLFDINHVCKDLGLTSISHILKRAILRNTSFESFFNHSLEYRVASQTSSNDWCSIAKSLLTGFSDKVYLSKTELQGKLHSFYRYNIYPVRNNQQKTAVIDSSSTLARSIKDMPVSLILVRDIHCSTAVRARSILSFIGEIQAVWMSNSLEREFKITNNEKQKFENEIQPNPTFKSISKTISIEVMNDKIRLSGIAGEILITEIYIRKQFISENKTPLLSDSEIHEGLKRNVTDLVNFLYILNPLKWRWKAERQVIITFRKAGTGCEVTVEARDREFKSVRKELDSFIEWLKGCVVLHVHSGIPPRQLKSRLPAVEERIARLTDIKLTSADLWSSVCGPQATRESRMEVVAWIAICKFYCKLEGGFVRDWVVDKKIARPENTDPSKWLTVNYTSKIPYLDQALIPSDLDCHLPFNRYFDIEQFLDEIYKFEIETQVFRQDWRYVLLFDEHYPTGPFTMDLIEPHVALTHDRIDLDVNNLYVERDQTKDLGQRVDLHEPPCSIDLEQTIENIQKKQFRVLRDVEYLVEMRINKMTNRGWKQYGAPLSFIPAPADKDTFVEVELPSQTPTYRTIVEDFKKIENARILSIKQLRNPALENAYEASKRLIVKECPGKNPNERLLYHGTAFNNANSIMEKGFDNRYFSDFGLYGYGAYFADNPAKSHGYTKPNSSGGTTRIMFYNKVILGVPDIMNTTNTALRAPKVGYHSVQGTAYPMTEYIVYTNTQALPFLKITYDTGA